MTHDINDLRSWIRVVILVAAIFTTAVPVLYSFFPWRMYRIGKLFMLQAISFAAAMDLSALFSFLAMTDVDILVVFWIDAIVLTAIAVSTAALAWVMVRMLILKFKAR